MEDLIYLKDIAGYEDVKAEVLKIIEVLRDFKKYEAMGVYTPKGLVLSGAPGVGKTMFAKAIATESGVPFFEFESNESETEQDTIKSIKDLFAKAREHTPSIIFIDELDELVNTDEFVSDYSRKVTKIILTEIDGISKSDGTMVIATTNHKTFLPGPLTRSGRMDKMITIEKPDTIDREKIFELYLSKHDSLKHINAKELAIRTAEFTGADIKTLINETMIHCVSLGKEVTLEDFENNIPVILFKEIKKTKRSGPSDIVCYHEIGHFVAQYVLNNKIAEISTHSFGAIQGYITVNDNIEIDSSSSDDTPGIVNTNNLENKLICYLSGMAAEKVYCGCVSNGSASDVSKARTSIRTLMGTGAFGFGLLTNERLSHMGGLMDMLPISGARLEKQEEFESKMLEDAFDKAVELVKDNTKLVDALYKELKVAHRLSVRETTQIVSSLK